MRLKLPSQVVNEVAQHGKKAVTQGPAEGNLVPAKENVTSELAQTTASTDRTV